MDCGPQSEPISMSIRPGERPGRGYLDGAGVAGREGEAEKRQGGLE